MVRPVPEEVIQAMMDDSTIDQFTTVMDSATSAEINDWEVLAFTIGTAASIKSARSSLPDKVNYLLNRGAYPNAPRDTAHSAFAVAASAGFIPELTLMYNAGADLARQHPPTYMTAVELAAAHGHDAAVKHITTLMAL